MAVPAVSFNNPPLVELIAELRWQVPGKPAGTAPDGMPIMVYIEQGATENFLMRLAGVVYQSGYQRTERILPPGMPLIPFQPICRYRSDEKGKQSTALQAGFQTFSIHALPPYESWEKFTPIVQAGIEALVKAAGVPQGEKLSWVALRYIDVFRGSHLGGKTAWQFVTEVLGLKLQLPPALVEHVSDVDAITPGIALTLPLHDGLQMLLQLAPGQVDGEQGVRMDTTVFLQQPVELDRDRIMHWLECQHAIIREIFIAMTAGIHDSMKPKV